MKRIHLDADDLALGHVMAQSKKNREQLIDHSYNRYKISNKIVEKKNFFV